MKKRIAISLLAAVVLMLAACGSKTDTIPASSDTEQIQQTHEIQTGGDTQTDAVSSAPEYTGIYRRMWSEEIDGTVVELNSYIVLNEDGTGCWIAQDVGTLTWDESRLTLTVGAAYETALTQENGSVNLLVYEFQDAGGAWIPTVYEKIEELPAEIEKMFDLS